VYVNKLSFQIVVQLI